MITITVATRSKHRLL